MLSPSKRPRAPSAAALRVLYRLAYVTSGTALGVGVLCAEERRRRCKLVQKVADNARRLHSTSRYRRNAAVDEIDWNDDSNINFALTRAALKNSAGVRAAGLPSVVHEAYEQLTEDDKPRRRKKRRDDAEAEKEHTIETLVQHPAASNGQFGFLGRPPSATTRKRLPVIPSARRSAMEPLVQVHENNSHLHQRSDRIGRSQSAAQHVQKKNAAGRKAGHKALAMSSDVTFSAAGSSKQDKGNGLEIQESPFRKLEHRKVMQNSSLQLETSQDNPSIIRSEKSRSLQLQPMPNTADQDQLIATELLQSQSQVREILVRLLRKHGLPQSGLQDMSNTLLDNTRVMPRYMAMLSWLERQQTSDMRVEDSTSSRRSSAWREQLKKHADWFLGTASEAKLQQGNSHTIPATIASLLLEVACDHMAIDCIYNLVSWKTSTMRIAKSDIDLLTQHWQDLAKQSGWQRTTDMITTSFDAWRVNQSDDACLRLAVGLCTNYINAASAVVGAPNLSKLAEFGPLYVARSFPESTRVVQQECTNLLESGSIPTAIRLITAFPFQDQVLARKLFSTALDNRSLNLCTLIIAWTGGSLLHEIIDKREVESFVDVAVKSSDHKDVRAMFLSEGMNTAGNLSLVRRSTSRAFFSQQCLLNFCTAFGQQTGHRKRNHRIFRSAFDALTKENQNTIRGSCPEESFRMLRDTWHLTRDLSEFIAGYHLIKQALNDQGRAKDACRLQISAIKICSKARDVRLAREIYESIDQTAPSSVRLLAAGLILTSEKDWSAFEALLSSADKQPSSLEHEDDGHTMHELMYTFAEHHDCERTRRFSDKLLKAFSSSPSRQTYTMLLKTAITKKRLDLLQEWSLEFSQAERASAMDRNLVYELLARYCQTHNVDINLFAWVVYVIREYVPSLDSEAVDRLLSTAYAEYMMRNKEAVYLKDQRQTINYTKIQRKVIIAKTRMLDRGKIDAVSWSKEKLIPAVRAEEHEPSPAAHKARMPEQIRDNGSIVATHIQAAGARPDNQNVLLPSRPDEPLVHDATTTSKLAADAIATKKIAQKSSTVVKTPLRSKLVAAMALHDYSDVINLYSKHIGHGSDRFALTLAVIASIRRDNGGLQQAENILRAAREHHIDTSGAEVFLKISNIRGFNKIGKEAAQEIYDSTLHEFRNDLRNGAAIKEYITVEAVKQLINLKSLRQAALLMETIDRVLSGLGKSFSLVAMTVWLRTYKDMDDFSSAIRITHRVLKSGMIIDRAFKNMVSIAASEALKSKGPDLARRQAVAHKLASLLEDCSTRLEQQDSESSHFAWGLARTIISIADPGVASWALDDMAKKYNPSNLVHHNAKRTEEYLSQRILSRKPYSRSQGPFDDQAASNHRLEKKSGAMRLESERIRNTSHLSNKHIAQVSFLAAKSASERRSFDLSTERMTASNQEELTGYGDISDIVHTESRHTLVSVAG